MSSIIWARFANWLRPVLLPMLFISNIVMNLWRIISKYSPYEHLSGDTIYTIRELKIRVVFCIRNNAWMITKADVNIKKRISSHITMHIYSKMKNDPFQFGQYDIILFSLERFGCTLYYRSYQWWLAVIFISEIRFSIYDLMNMKGHSKHMSSSIGQKQLWCSLNGGLWIGDSYKKLWYIVV